MKPSTYPDKLTTARLCLRQFDRNDLPVLLSIFQEPGLLDYFPPTAPPDEARVARLIQRQLEHWAEHGYGWWGVTLKDTPALLGWCGLQYLPETGETEVGYGLAHAAWGRGYASEAARAAVDAGFAHLPLTEIIGLTHPDNIASQRVLQKAGMGFEGEFEYFGMVCRKYSRTVQAKGE
jgi:ribosomal-protein-alanine N-acetyltransferase